MKGAEQKHVATMLIQNAATLSERIRANKFRRATEDVGWSNLLEELTELGSTVALEILSDEQINGFPIAPEGEIQIPIENLDDPSVARHIQSLLLAKRVSSGHILVGLFRFQEFAGCLSVTSGDLAKSLAEVLSFDGDEIQVLSSRGFPYFSVGWDSGGNYLYSISFPIPS